MKLQSGWPVYALLGLLSMLSLLSLRPLQRSTQDVSGDVPPQLPDRSPSGVFPEPESDPGARFDAFLSTAQRGLGQAWSQWQKDWPTYQKQWERAVAAEQARRTTATLDLAGGRALKQSVVQVGLAGRLAAWQQPATRLAEAYHVALASAWSELQQALSPWGSDAVSLYRQALADYQLAPPRRPKVESFAAPMWRIEWGGIVIAADRHMAELQLRIGERDLRRWWSATGMAVRERLREPLSSWSERLRELAPQKQLAEFAKFARQVREAEAVAAAELDSASQTSGGEESSRSRELPAVQASSRQALPSVPVAPSVRRTARTTWPYAEHLARAIDELPAEHDYCEVRLEPWRSLTLIDLDRLAQRSTLEDRVIAQDLSDLNRRFAELERLLAEVPVDQNPKELRAIRYDLAKWIAIWTLVHQAATERSAAATRLEASFASVPQHAEVLAALDAVRQSLTEAGSSVAWTRFLELDTLRAAFADPAHPAARQATIDRVLTRMEMARTNAAQREILQQASVRRLRQALLASGAAEGRASGVDLSGLLFQLEVYEQQPWEMIGTKLLAHSRRLERDASPAAQQLGQLIETHYRNANFRLSVSERFLNRLIPPASSLQEPVQDEILGARVFGHSQTVNTLRVDLQPNPHELQVELLASGQVNSLTQAQKGPFVFHNRGLGRFQAAKAVLIGPDHFRMRPTQVVAINRNRTLGVQSDLDVLPIIGSLARSFALQQQNEKAPLARRIVETKIAAKARTRIDDEVGTRLTNLESRLADRVIGPLDDLDLVLQPIEHRTTEERLTVRYRLAGDEQLAAFTARPQALSKSEMSVQLHQSLANNLLRRLQLEGRTFAVTELYEHLQKVTGREIPPPESIDPQVEFTFAGSDCLELRCQDGKLSLTVRFAKLSIGPHTRWRNLAVTADYQPELNGLRLAFIRVPGSTLRLQGRQLGFRDQMSIRTIFNKVFDDRQALPGTPDSLLTDARFQDLSVSQCEIRDGWVGLSFESQH